MARASLPLLPNRQQQQEQKAYFPVTPLGYQEITVEGEGRGEHVIEKVFCVSLNLAKEAERELLHDPGSGELSRYVREQRLAPQCLP